MRSQISAFISVAALSFLLAVPALAASAGEDCRSNSDCSTGACVVQEADCGKKIIRNSVSLSATGKRVESCEPVRAVCAARPQGCAAVMSGGVIRYECGTDTASP